MAAPTGKEGSAEAVCQAALHAIRRMLCVSRHCCRLSLFSQDPEQLGFRVVWVGFVFNHCSMMSISSCTMSSFQQFTHLCILWILSGKVVI